MKKWPAASIPASRSNRSNMLANVPISGLADVALDLRMSMATESPCRNSEALLRGNISEKRNCPLSTAWSGPGRGGPDRGEPDRGAPVRGDTNRGRPVKGGPERGGDEPDSLRVHHTC